MSGCQRRGGIQVIARAGDTCRNVDHLDGVKAPTNDNKQRKTDTSTEPFSHDYPIIDQ
jgi:hypothetical protein